LCVDQALRQRGSNISLTRLLITSANPSYVFSILYRFEGAMFLVLIRNRLSDPRTRLGYRHIAEPMCGETPTYVCS